MATETYANRAQDTLASGISNVDVSLTLNDGSEFPATGTFRIVIESEILLVGSRSGAVLSGLTRGAEGTTAASHGSNVAVTHVLTRDGLQALGTVLHARDTLANLDAATLREGVMGFPTDGLALLRHGTAAKETWGPVFPLTRPIDADFAWVNQGTASVDTSRGGVRLIVPNAGSTNLRIRKKTAPATPYTVTMRFDAVGYPADYWGAGICFRESGSGKVAIYGLGYSGGPRLAIDLYNDPTTYAGTTYISVNPCTLIPYEIRYLRITDDGTNRKSLFSHNGIDFQELHSVARTNFLTANEIGFYADAPNAVAGRDCRLTVYSWLQE